MILEVDVGNSRIKWRLVESESSIAPALQYARDADDLIAALTSMTKPPQAVRMCSVRDATAGDRITEWVKQAWSLTVQVARVTQSCGGVRHQYADQTRLGVDRWLAMLAAYRLAEDGCIIVDSGTALTVDVVDASGLHLGGYIVPGLQLLRDTLERNTRIRLTPELKTHALQLGNSTDSAVCNGTLAALVSLINSVIAPTVAANPGTQVFFAGGDAELLARLSVAENYHITPSLVLDGLAIACIDS